MTRLAGRWAWWNENSPQSFDLELCVRRAKEAHLSGVIIKWGYPAVERAFIAAGVPWATERYALYSQPEVEGQRLANAVSVGAVAAVINAEEGGDEQTGGHWERDIDGQAMRTLIAIFRVRYPTVELYASVDTRGDRLLLPYQRVLAQHIAAWLPMIYPLAFYGYNAKGQRITPPADFVARAFADCLDGKDFGGIPVLPTIQTYDGIGAAAVGEELAEIKRRGLPGCQAYTIAHATDEEWAVFARQQETPMVLPTEIHDLWEEIRVRAQECKDVTGGLAQVLAVLETQKRVGELAVRIGRYAGTKSV